MKFKISIVVKLKEGLLNPEANTIQRSLNLIGYKNVSEFDTEKIFSMKVDAKSKEEAMKQADEMCRHILVNPVIQSYKISVV